MTRQNGKTAHFSRYRGVLGRDEPNLITACRERLSAGLAMLDPGGSSDGPRVPRWGLRANVRVAPEDPS